MVQKMRMWVVKLYSMSFGCSREKLRDSRVFSAKVLLFIQYFSSSNSHPHHLQISQVIFREPSSSLTDS